MSRRFIGLLKVIVPLGVIFGLLWHVARTHPDALRPLWAGEARVSLLVASVLLVLLAQLAAMVRWHLLLLGMRIPLRLWDTIQLGFLGQFMSLIAPGQVGGDLIKAVFIARKLPSRRGAAVATILIDRFCGLYALMLVASAAMWLSQAAQLHTSLAVLAAATYACTAAATVLVIVAMIPPITNSPRFLRLMELPLVGPMLLRALSALQGYQSQPVLLLLVGLLSIFVHTCLAFAMLVAASAMYTEVPTWTQHFVISPIAGVAGALPLTPGGLGSYELAMAKLYDLFSPPDAQGRGVVVSLLLRLGTIVCTGFGMAVYWLRFRELKVEIQPSTTLPK